MTALPLSTASPRSRANSTSVTVCERGRLPTCVTRIRSLLAFKSAFLISSAIHVVGVVVAGEPALELRVCVGAPCRVVLLDVRMIDGELDDHSVRIDRV